MSLEGKRVVVTGGAGFIGSHLVDNLIKEKPKEIFVIDNFSLGKQSNLFDAKQNFPNLNIINCDFTDYDKIEKIFNKENIDVVFNLAILPLPHSLQNPILNFNNNVKMTANICELMRKDLFDTVVHCSSSEVYGTNISNEKSMNESHPLDPKTTYAASKVAADKLLVAYANMYDLDYSIVRPFNTFGARQNEGSYAGIIPLTIKRILSGEKPIIFGDGNQTRDFTYVEDTANSFIKIYNNLISRGELYNVGTGKSISINYLVSLICQELNYNSEIIYAPPRVADVRHHLCDSSKIEDHIGFKPNIPFEDGIKKTVAWYKNMNV